MNLEPESIKKHLRQEIKARVRELSAEEKWHRSESIAQAATFSKAFISAALLMMYLPLPEEVDTWPIIQAAWAAGKQVAVPVTSVREKTIEPRLIRPGDEMHLVRGAFGIMEPQAFAPKVEVGAIELVFVPCVGFDAGHRRLGHGGGYYDRFLAGLSEGTPMIGLAFAQQRVDSIPSEPTDISLTDVLWA
ncbi:MAG: 5-formyltetrahydrofolate cyclo-ligase [Candidatus Omnitrophica bacterium]|nr:5-formyltetrahydrofolate cyclo-ligase [Candidatus Omnitrophota bacterium]